MKNESLKHRHVTATTRTLRCCLIAISLVATRATASTDLFLGEWKLNVQRSVYPAGTCPKQMTIEMTSTARGVRYHSSTTYANGTTTQAQYVADYNGKQAAVMGGRGFLLPVSLRRMDSRTVVASYMRGMQLIATSRRIVSSDGRTMTITTKSRLFTGKSMTSVGLYERVK
ncbi:MAG: hypothetical protein WA628_00130 [Terriglobales bacterium]